LGADILYGNDPTSKEEIYKRCAFFIKLPPFPRIYNEYYILENIDIINPNKVKDEDEDEEDEA
jgi:hypothetical protein